MTFDCVMRHRICIAYFHFLYKRSEKLILYLEKLHFSLTQGVLCHNIGHMEWIVHVYKFIWRSVLVKSNLEVQYEVQSWYVGLYIDIESDCNKPSKNRQICLIFL